MKELCRWLIVAFLLVSSERLLSAAEFFFKPNDRIVFLGDSITEQYQYSSTIELYLTTRFPDWKLVFLNAGIGGDRAQGGKNRFQDHVLAEKPTAITINFGMNDAGYGLFDQKLQSLFLEGTESMLTMAKSNQLRVALCSPNAVDRRVQDRFKVYIETQKEFYAPLKELAAKHNAVFADQYAITRTALEKMESDKADVVRPFYDGFHTASPGGLFMAHAILTQLNAPSLVSHVGIDSNAFGVGSGSKTIGCSISNESKTPDSVTFDRMDQALPIPIQPDWVSLLPYVNQLKDLNRYELLVTGLPAGQYSIKIDGVEVATNSSSDLSAGINLGNVTTGPIHEHGQKVFDAINLKNKIVHGRFRGVIMANIPDWLADVASERKPKELAKRSEQIQSKQDEIYQLVKPAKHRFEIVKRN